MALDEIGQGQMCQMVIKRNRLYDWNKHFGLDELIRQILNSVQWSENIWSKYI